MADQGLQRFEFQVQPGLPVNSYHLHRIMALLVWMLFDQDLRNVQFLQFKGARKGLPSHRREFYVFYFVSCLFKESVFYTIICYPCVNMTDQCLERFEFQVQPSLCVNSHQLHHKMARLGRVLLDQDFLNVQFLHVKVAREGRPSQGRKFYVFYFVFDLLKETVFLLFYERIK